MIQKDSIIPLSGLFPLRNIDGWIPLSFKNDDNIGVTLQALVTMKNSICIMCLSEGLF